MTAREMMQAAAVAAARARALAWQTRTDADQMAAVRAEREYLAAAAAWRAALATGDE